MGRFLLRYFWIEALYSFAEPVRISSVIGGPSWSTRSLMTRLRYVAGRNFGPKSWRIVMLMTAPKPFFVLSPGSIETGTRIKYRL